MKLASMVLCLSLALTVLPANAQSVSKVAHPHHRNANQQFMEPDTQSSRYFDQSFRDFQKSVSNSGQRMRRDYDRSNREAAHRYRVNAKAEATDTLATSQQAFNNTQVQAAASGGLYNAPGGFIAPNFRGRYYGSTPVYGNSRW